MMKQRFIDRFRSTTGPAGKEFLDIAIENEKNRTSA